MNPFSSFVPNKKSLRNLAQRFIIISIYISYMPLLFVSIVRTALSNLQHAIGYLKDKPILLIDAHAVKAAPVAAQRLRLSYTVTRFDRCPWWDYWSFSVFSYPWFAIRYIQPTPHHAIFFAPLHLNEFMLRHISSRSYVWILRSRIVAFSEDQNGSAMTSKGMRLSLLSLFR